MQHVKYAFPYNAKLEIMLKFDYNSYKSKTYTPSLQFCAHANTICIPRHVKKNDGVGGFDAN